MKLKLLKYCQHFSYASSFLSCSCSFFCPEQLEAKLFTSHQLLIRSCFLLVSFCLVISYQFSFLVVTSYFLPITSFLLVTFYQLLVTFYQLSVTFYQLLVVFYQLLVTIYCFAFYQLPVFLSSIPKFTRVMIQDKLAHSPSQVKR